MFAIKNGILHKNGGKVLALGQSYYPSYHEKKVPVPPEQNRVEEMKIDLQQMTEAGFNIIRMAALGSVTKGIDNRITTEFPFIDAMCSYAQEVGIATMVRLHGYAYNFGGYSDAVMLNQYNNEMPFFWWAFVRNCLNHPGILKDNAEATVASAIHFKGFPSVVGFQIYNEPAYPHLGGHYDYNPHSIRAWRKWLVENKLREPDEVEQLDAPRAHPSPDEDIEPWVQWNLFRMERLNDFLNLLSNKAKEGYPGIPTMTCHMPCPISYGSAIRGEDYFRVAKEMDAVGITHYFPAHGQAHYVASSIIDLAESAAAVYGKHAWIVEYNGRVDLSAEEWERETFSALGSGIKGIIYYQWRADYPFADAPEPETFGMIRSDRTKTKKYDRAVALNRLLEEIGGVIVDAEKERCEIAILFSEYANAVGDAKGPGRELSIAAMRRAYAELRETGIAIDFVRSCDLKDNVLQAKITVVPAWDDVSQNEQHELAAYEQQGGIVVRYDLLTGAFTHAGSKSHDMNATELLNRFGIGQLWSIDVPRVDAKVLRGNANNHVVVTLIHYACAESTIPYGKVLTLNLRNAEQLTEAMFYYPGRAEKLRLQKVGDKTMVTLPEFSTGGIIVLSRSL